MHDPELRRRAVDIARRLVSAPHEPVEGDFSRYDVDYVRGVMRRELEPLGYRLASRSLTSTLLNPDFERGGTPTPYEFLAERIKL